MSTSVKVTTRIPDISPTLTLRRDKAYTTYPPNRKRYALPSMEVIREIEPNFAWTRLPNMAAYKSAIVRNKVCEGLMYLLPGGKNSMSVARPYTAELGAMFSEPYVGFKPEEYNEENVKESSGVHFSPNTHITRLSKHQVVKRQPSTLNSDSKQSYTDYDALVSKKHTDSEEGKGNLPVTVKVGEAELELQKEVQKILDEVDVHGNQLGSEDADDRPYSSLYNSPSARHVNSHTNATGNANSKTSLRFSTSLPPALSPIQAEPKNVKDFREHHYRRKTAQFKDYKHLRNAEVPRPKLAEEFKSRYLSESKTEEIWNWLNWDFSKSKFEHFVEVCS